MFGFLGIFLYLLKDRFVEFNPFIQRLDFPFYKIREIVFNCLGIKNKIVIYVDL